MCFMEVRKSLVMLYVDIQQNPVSHFHTRGIRVMKFLQYVHERKVMVVPGIYLLQYVGKILSFISGYLIRSISVEL